MSYPVLYDANATDFFNLGLGLLDEATRVNIIEERNGPFYLEMDYPIVGKCFSDLKKSNIIKSNAGPELLGQRFRISQIGKTSDDWTVTIYAEHVSYMAQDLAMKPIVHILTLNCQEALRVWKGAIIDSNPFTVSSDIATVTSTDWHIRDVQNPRLALGGVEGSLLDKYGGEYKFDNYHISLLKQRGKRANTIVSYGRNIIDLQQEENITNTFTSVYPYATYENENKVEQMVTINGYVVDSEYVGKYPHRKVLPIDFSSEFEQEEIPTKARLKKLGEDFVKNNNVGVPNVSIKLTYVDLAQTLDYKDSAANEIVNLCDELPVSFDILDIETTSKVVRVVWNELLDRYDSVELGHSRTTLSNVISNIEKNVNQVQTTINEVQIATNGKNMVFRGPDTPTAQSVGDSWYKPNGEDVELYIWDGATWEFIMSTKPDPKIQEAIDNAKEAAEKAQEDADTAMAKADESNAKAIQAVSEAGFAKDQANQAQILANSVNNQLPAIKQDAKDALDAYNNLSIGAMNYIMNSSGKDEFPTFDGINAKPANIALSSTADGWCKAKVTAASQTPYYFIGGYTPTSIYFGPDKTIRPGYEYTFSSQVRVLTVDTPVCLTMYVWDSSGLKTHFSQYARTVGTHDLELTIKVPEGATNILVGYRTPGIPPINDSWDFREAQLEASNKKSNWKPNPQDVQVQITKINGELSSKVSQTQFNLLQGTVTNQGTQINQNKTDIALKANQSEVNTLTGRVTAAEGSLIVQSSKIEGLVTKTDGQGVEIGQLKVQSNNIQLQVSALPDYIQSRGQNLVTNGMGSLGTNQNFSTMVYDGSERDVGVGSFRTAVGGSAHMTSEYIPFDSTKIYEFGYSAKSLNSAGRFFAFYAPYDVDKLQITYFTMAGKGYGDKTLPFITKLTRPLKVGDTEVYVEDSSGFTNNGTNLDHRHSLLLWGYKNKKGYEYPVGTYSQLQFTYAWNPGDVNVSEKKITFRKPFNFKNPNSSDGIFPIGYELSPTASGGTYLYPSNATDILLPKTWTQKRSKITGVANYSTNLVGTQYVKDFVGYLKLGWLVNRGTADTTWVNGVTLSDVTEAVNNEVNIASIQIQANGIQSQVLTKAEQSEVTQLAGQITSVVTDNKVNSGYGLLSDALMLKTDPYFEVGNNGVGAYGTGVTVVRESLDGGTQPSGIKSRMRITTPNPTSPVYGGFSQPVVGRVNAIFIHKFTANLPVGRTLQPGSNSLGTGGKLEWLTPAQGTGKWTEYMVKITCGTGGTFGSFGFIYVTGGTAPTPEVPLVWYLSDSTIYDVTRSNQSQITQLSSQITLEVNTLNNTKADKTQLTLLQDQINLKVQKGDTISQINIEAGKTLIQTNSLILSAATVTFTGYAFIPAASIVSLNAEKINTGILNAANVKVINIDAANVTTGYINANRIESQSITADKLTANAIQVGFNNMGTAIKISPYSLSFYAGSMLTGQLTEDGMSFWYGTRKIGRMGESQKAGNANIRGLSTNLENTGDYITWSYRRTEAATTYTILLTLDPKGSFTGYSGIHINDKLYINDLIAIKSAYQDLRFSSITYSSYNYPSLTNGAMTAGVLFGSELYFMRSNTVYSLNDIVSVTTRLKGLGTVQIPTSIRSDGSVASWRIITL